VSLNGEKQGRFRNPLPIHQLRLEKSAKGQGREAAGFLWCGAVNGRACGA
jgi:hypothetical protein